MHKRDFTLFFSMPLDDLDWSNLAASKVQRVMLPLDLAYESSPMLDRLRLMGVSIVLRISETAYYDDSAPARILAQVRACAQHCSIFAVIVGCEPDVAFLLHDGSPSWGQAHAWEHRARFDAVRRALQLARFSVISPGWAVQVRLPDGSVGRSISEDDTPPPGLRDWVVINTAPDQQREFGYDAADGNGVHLYNYNADGPIDDLRFKDNLKLYCTLFHKPIYIDEIGVGNNESALGKMRAYIDWAQVLLSSQAGKRVMMYCPFVSNGNPGIPPAWLPSYLLRDPQAYVELGRWMVR